MNVKDIGVVLSYNTHQFMRTCYPAKSGSRIEWKRNGARGSVNAIILGYNEEKPYEVFIQNWMPDWSRPVSGKSNVWIKKASVLKVL